MPKRLPAGTAPHASKIIATYRRATEEQLAAGVSWYADAHSVALALDPEQPERAAGILAALSPRMPWDRNVLLAARTYADGQASGTLKGNARKADRILAGERWQDVLGGDKVRAFAATIADPTDPDAVVIDRHAFDVAVGRVTDDATRSVLSRVGVYERFAEEYRKAARTLGVPPSVVQAVTWVVWREEKGLDSAPTAPRRSAERPAGRAPEPMSTTPITVAAFAGGLL